MKCEQCGSQEDVRVNPMEVKLRLCMLCRESYFVRPKIVCLCGSTRFYEDFARIRFAQTLQGNIVLTIGCDTKQDNDFEFTEEMKQELDRLHMHKVRMADEVIVINRDGYIGESTSREIHMAKLHNKRIRYEWPEYVPDDGVNHYVTRT